MNIPIHKNVNISLNINEEYYIITFVDFNIKFKFTYEESKKIVVFFLDIYNNENSNVKLYDGNNFTSIYYYNKLNAFEIYNHYDHYITGIIPSVFFINNNGEFLNILIQLFFNLEFHYYDKKNIDYDYRLKLFSNYIRKMKKIGFINKNFNKNLLSSCYSLNDEVKNEGFNFYEKI